MSRYTVIPSPALEAQLDSALEGMARTLDSIRPRGLACVVLGGGYGRGEGGVWHSDTGDRLYNDLDLFAFSEGAGRRERQRIGEVLRRIAEEWEKKLGVAVDFSPVKDLTALPGVTHTLMLLPEGLHLHRDRQHEPPQQRQPELRQRRHR